MTKGVNEYQISTKKSLMAKENNMEGIIIILCLLGPIAVVGVLIKLIIEKWDKNNLFFKYLSWIACAILPLVIFSYFRQDYEFLKEGSTIYRMNKRSGHVDRVKVDYFSQQWDKVDK